MKFVRRSILLLLTLLLILPSSVFAEQTSAQDGTLSCAFFGPDEVQSYVDHLFDGDPVTTVTLRRGETLRMEIDGGTPAALFFDFYERTGEFTLTFADANGAPLGEQRCTADEYHVLLPVPYDSVAAVTLRVDKGDVRLCEWFACTDSFTPQFSDTGETADVLAVLNEPGDELYRFGGLFALLAGEHGLSVQVVYLTGTDGYHAHQCMDVLSGMGVLRMPSFGTGRKTDAKNDDSVFNAIGRSPVLIKQFTALIRTVRPKLLLTLDPGKDQTRYSDGVIARTLLTAADYAADETRYPNSTAFAVPKVYALSADGETTVSLAVPLYAYDGVTADALAERLSETYASERVFRRTLPAKLCFTLRAECVGADEARNDLLEHLSTDAFEHYRIPTPTPEPTEEPTPTPTETPTELPRETPRNTPAPTAEPSLPAPVHRRSMLLPVLGGIGLAAAAVLFVLFFKKKEKGILIAAIVLLLAGALALTLWSVPKGAVPVTEAATEAPTEKPTPKLTEAPTPKPTEAPTEEPTPEPTEAPTPDPNEAYFLSGDGEEYELDFENGRWEYRSNALSIDVRRVNTKYKNGKPLVYYVADIRMRDYSSFRSGVRGYAVPWRYARMEKAVLAFTGDNLDGAEKEEKGCLMRNGRFYCDYGGAETLVIRSDLTLEVRKPKSFTARELIDRGVRDTYSFGPVLVENGEICDSVYHHRVMHPNPRCGLGMVEPGHWVAIVSDGRQRGYSESITLSYFAQLFVENGCTVAYNLDGGSSVGLIFMGEALNQHDPYDASDYQRPWTDALMFGYSEQVPDPSVPTKHDGYRR